ncbi:MAG: indolepyruvate oxidoreductase subunit beta [Anaerolineae bacterium]|nr:indolepyruvate oxidoreductase subunit beta [Anaerolineae bacterium]
MTQKTDFLLAGVGGQGTLLASNILAEVGLRAGYDVKKSEVHGMAQRGGSVTSHVRWAEKVYSPLIGQGEVDYLVAFERLEALRYIEQLRPGGTLLVSEHGIPPISVTAGKDQYPTTEQMIHTFDQVAGTVIWIPSIKLAEELGNARVHNIIMLGALSTQLNVEEQVWLEIIEQRVPARFIELNKKAFQRGREVVTGHQ